MRNIQVNNEERKYKTYADSMLATAKLYNDSYSKETVSLELREKFNTSKVELMDWMLVTTCHSCEKKQSFLTKESHFNKPKGVSDYQTFEACNMTNCKW